MLPKTSTQIEIISLSKKLKPISEEALEYGYKKVFFDRVAYTKGNQYVCSECGKSFAPTPKGKSIACPHCKSRLIKGFNNCQKKEKRYYGLCQTAGEYQVMRYFMLFRKTKRGVPASYWNSEVVQQWFDSKGKRTVISKKIQYGWYNDNWDYDSEMEIKRVSINHYGTDRYDINPYAYDKKKYILPALKRNGFTGNMHKFGSSVELFKRLLNEPQFETLWKARYFNFCTLRQKSLSEKWGEVKVCMRNGYKPKDYTMWYDYIGSLKELGVDFKNAKYCCPKDLKKEHDRYQAKVDEKRKEEMLRKRMEQIEDEERQYFEEKKMYLGIDFGDDKLEISPLKSVREFLEEGTKMHHCVFSSSYYKHKDCLIFSAKDKKGERVATIEWDINRKSVVQIRGAFNEKPEQFDEILSLFTKNKKAIIKAV